jgi:hypothetical protein
MHKETGSHVSLYEYESVKSELDIVRSQFVTSQSKLTILESEKQALKQQLNSLKSTVEWSYR